MASDDASPLIPLATKLFVSPGQILDRGVISDAPPGDTFARRIIAAAEKQSLYDLAKIASDRYRRPLREVWSEILGAIAAESFATEDFRSGALVVYQVHPLLFCWACSKIIGLHLEGIVPFGDDESSLSRTSISMASRGVDLVAKWSIGQASSSKLLGESPSIADHLSREVSRISKEVYTPADLSWASAAIHAVTLASVLAEGVPVEIDDFVLTSVVRSMVMAAMAEHGLVPSLPSRKVAASVLAEELYSTVVKFPLPDHPYLGAGRVGGGGVGAAALGVVAGAAATFLVRRRR